MELEPILQMVCRDRNRLALQSELLSAYVLGVRTDGPVWNKRIIIEPRLGDLKFAEGIVVTEHGLAGVSWKRADNGKVLDFRLEVPAGTRAKVSVPRVSERPTLIVNGKTVVSKGKVAGQAVLEDRFATLELGSGKYSGKMK